MLYTYHLDVSIFHQESILSYMANSCLKKDMYKNKQVFDQLQFLDVSIFLQELAPYLSI